MLVRSAFRPDIDKCLELDGSYEADQVWQVEQREDHLGISVALRPVHLPRPVRVSYPSPGREMRERWERGSCLMVAELDGHMRGYIDVGAHCDQGFAFVHNLVIEGSYRRRGLGTALVKEAMRWGHHRSLRRIMFAVQSKNHPAVQFCGQLGLVFCGFNDRYFANRDIALFFSSK